MDYLRLGLTGISAAEVSLVSTLFRLHRVDPSFIWTLASEPPFDALLADINCSPDQYEALKGAGTKLMRLGGIDCAGPDTLPRPIRSDLLVRWLNSIEVEILHSSRDPFASTSVDSLQGHNSLSPRTLAPMREQAKTTPAPAAVPAHLRQKLRRWPTAALLAGEVNRIRMATMLSRRPLSVVELSNATRVPVEECSAFWAQLQAASLLETVASPTLTETSAVTMPSEPSTQPTPSKARGIGRSLLQSIRHRFGL